MEKAQKKRLLETLIFEKKVLMWAAQLKDESAKDFGNRMSDQLIRYTNMGYHAQNFFSEVMETPVQREECAIYAFVQGCKPEIARYMCLFTFYSSLRQARVHAEKIEKNLIDLKQIKRGSVQIVPESFST